MLAVGRLSYWRRFHVRMSVLYAGVVFFILALMGVAFYQVGVKHQLHALKSRLRMAATTLSHQIRAEAVLALNVAADREKSEYRELIDLFRRFAAEEPQLVSIYVLRTTNRPNVLSFAADFVTPGRTAPAAVGEDYDARQAPKIMNGLLRPVVEDEFVTDKWGTVLSGYAPIRTAAGTAIAVVGVDVSEGDVAKLKSDILGLTCGVFGFAGICIGLLALIVGRSVRKPLGQITAATTEIAAGRLETRVQIDRDDEFGILGRHLDQMAAGLGEREIIRATFGRFVSEDVARRILASSDGAALGGEERIVTVMLVDLANYSTLSEKLAAADVVLMLNTFFGLMGEVIDRHHGCVIEFPGDGILCVFGAPDTLPNHAELAVECAIGMQAALAAANQDWAQVESKLWYGQGESPLRMRIGIHTGPVIAGNIGTRTRAKYSVIGDSVNVAARVEQLSKELATSTLMTTDTFKRVSDTLRRQAVCRGEHRIKGRVNTVEVYSI